MCVVFTLGDSSAYFEGDRTLVGRREALPRNAVELPSIYCQRGCMLCLYDLI